MHRQHLFEPCLLLVLLPLLLGASPVSSPVVESDLPAHDAIYANQPPGVLEDIQQHLEVVAVHFMGLDGKRHQGQLVVNRAVREDIIEIFRIIEETGFPIESVLPIAHPAIQQKGAYGISPDTNNTSAYVWRPNVTSHRLSLHALGLAVDINPRRNPYIRGAKVLPPGATYAPGVPGTLTADSPVVRAFTTRGWSWGGHWTGKTVDYMHFQKIPDHLREWVARYR